MEKGSLNLTPFHSQINVTEDFDEYDKPLDDYIAFRDSKAFTKHNPASMNLHLDESSSQE